MTIRPDDLGGVELEPDPMDPGPQIEPMTDSAHRDVEPRRPTEQRLAALRSYYTGDTDGAGDVEDLFHEIDALLARLEQVEQERDEYNSQVIAYRGERIKAEARAQELGAALEPFEEATRGFRILPEFGADFWTLSVRAHEILELRRALAPDTAPPTYASEEEMLEAKYDPADTAEER